ncbi:MAG: Dabb family protein [Acidobacteria bacterium]|nr:MAG: Dabb family protein [Acidobacteriota bacterium]
MALWRARMLHHFVLLRLKADITPQQTDAFINEAREVLGPIQGVQNLRVGFGLGVKSERSYPIALIMDFEDEAALEAYQVHPEHQRFVKEIVGPIQDDKQVYDYLC